MSANWARAFNAYGPGVMPLIPLAGLENPKLKFMDSSGHAIPSLPDMPEYSQSSWYVTQWKKLNQLKPSTMVRNPASDIDPFLGIATFAFPTPSNECHIWIFNDPSTGKKNYELYGEHGWLDTVSGSNFFCNQIFYQAVIRRCNIRSSYK